MAIVDYRLGNLFSVKQACTQAGMEGVITSHAEEILAADAVILPGVGAFGDAMAALSELRLVEPLKACAHSGKPLVGICLGLQLLMSESFEFGRHQGLGLIEGDVMKLSVFRDGNRLGKVPHIGWNQVKIVANRESRVANSNRGSRLEIRDSLFENVPDGAFMYFVHSFYARPKDPSAVLCTTCYGPTTFCSAIRKGNIVAFQFHPERSGAMGLKIYQNIAQRLSLSMETREEGNGCQIC